MISLTALVALLVTVIDGPDRARKHTAPTAPPVSSRDTTIDVARGVTFDINKASGRLMILAWDKPTIRVRVIGPIADPYDIVRGAGTISIRSRHATVPQQPSITVTGTGVKSNATVKRDAPDPKSVYEITVPRGMSGKAGGVGADVEVTGTEASIHAVVLNGDLSVTNVRGTVTLESLSGNVTARQVTGTLSISSPNEHVTVEDATGSVLIR
ncbi:MAG: hypothetical protein ABI556_15425, partial [Gemmatimonadales bacterium]